MKDYVTIKLDKKRRLRYTLGSFEMLQKQVGLTGDKAEKLLKEKFKKPDFKYLTLFIWSGLLSDSPELTLKQVEEILKPFKEDPVKLVDLGITIAKALNRALEKVNIARKKIERFNKKIKNLK